MTASHVQAVCMVLEGRLHTFPPLPNCSQSLRFMDSANMAAPAVTMLPQYLSLCPALHMLYALLQTISQESVCSTCPV
jgi:hypothetical protein